ncbi:MAG: zinc-ribbon domain-containing protein [Alphaproteobacteria bacterium]|nr:zinc-ribbon domain-containing protein [Alphaproteobacteria bacterium]
MILQCEKCLKRFLIPTHLLGDKGRKVRCAGCSHTWFQAPMAGDSEERMVMVPVPMAMEGDSINPTPPPIPEHSSLPVTSSEKKSFRVLPKWIKPASFGLMVLNLALVFVLYQPYLFTLTLVQPLYSALGMASTQNVGFQHVTLTLDNEHKGGVVINGSIYNASNKPVILKPVRLSTMSKRYKRLGERVSKDLVGVKLKPYGSYDFEAAIPGLSNRVEYVVLDFGSPFELFLR